MIHVSSALKRALQKVAENSEQKQHGLYVPDYIAGKHFGGFNGYEAWIQDCVRACCEAVKEVGEDELSELTAIAMWQPDQVVFFIDRHPSAMMKLERYSETAPWGGRELESKFIEQVARVQGSRGRGTLLVIAMNPIQAERTGELPACVSAWNPASLEEAAAVPKQRYLLG